jgi:hypothetical protein
MITNNDTKLQGHNEIRLTLDNRHDYALSRGLAGVTIRAGEEVSL